MRKLALAVFALHLVANPHYGFFRDELYFIICGRHPQFGYVDQPPLIPLLAAASQIFGNSLFLLRAVSAAFGALCVYVTILLVEELEGGRFAQALAGIAAALAPILCVFGTLVGPDDATIVAWPLLALLVQKIRNGASPRLWLAAGAVAGLALEAKYSAIFFIAALLVTNLRLFSKWMLGGAAVCALVAAPSLVWQAAHHVPMLEVLQAGQRGKNVILTPLQFLGQQALLTNPAFSLIWICGFVRARWLALASALTLLVVMALHGKDYYAVGIYPGLFAAGAVAIESWLAPRARPAVLVAEVLLGLPLVPLAVPILPEASFVAYQKALHLEVKPSEHHQQAALPQVYADMHGWAELTETMRSVVATLTPEERSRATIMARNYGEASALNFFGKGELPPAISGHNQYFLWGPQNAADVLIDIDGDCGKSLQAYADARNAAVISAKWVMPYEDHLPVTVCRGRMKPLAELWPLVKHYD